MIFNCKKINFCDIMQKFALNLIFQRGYFQKNDNRKNIKNNHFFLHLVQQKYVKFCIECKKIATKKLKICVRRKKIDFLNLI